MKNVLQKAEKFYEKIDFNNAIKEAERLWRHNSKTERLANFLGLLYDQKAMIDQDAKTKAELRQKSALYHRQALKVNPESLEAYLGLGRLFMHKNQFAKAIAYYKKVNKINPKSYDAQNGLGNIYKRTNRLSLALRWYEKALENAPKKSIILTNIARLYKSKNDFKNASKTAQKALLELKKERRRQNNLIKNLKEELREIIKQA